MLIHRHDLLERGLLPDEGKKRSVLLLMIKILHYLKTLNYGNDGKFLIQGSSGFMPSNVVLIVQLPFGSFSLKEFLVHLVKKGFRV